MEHEPSRLLGYTKRTAKLMGANTILAVHQEPEGRKPLGKADGRILKDRAYLDAELTATLPALPPLLGLQVIGLIHRAPIGALRAIRPAHLGYSVNADLLIGEVLNGFKKCLWAAHEPRIRDWRGLVKYILPLRRGELLVDNEGLSFSSGLNAKAQLGGRAFFALSLAGWVGEKCQLCLEFISFGLSGLAGSGSGLGLDKVVLRLGGRLWLGMDQASATVVNRQG